MIMLKLFSRFVHFFITWGEVGVDEQDFILLEVFLFRGRKLE